MRAMAKQIILYNLARNVTDEAYKEYVIKEKGPFLNGLPSVTKYEAVKITGAASGKIPYKYIGIIHIKNLDNFLKKDTTTQKFKEFQAKMGTMLTDLNVLIGEEIY
jgi:hypothetical protein